MVRSPLLSLAAAAAVALATGAGVTGAQAATPGIWQVLRSVSPDPTKVDDSSFAGVSMASASDGWAVGNFTNPQAVNQPLAEHWNGRAWRITAAPPLPKAGASGMLSGVDEVVGPANVWAVGSFTLAAGGTRTLIEHFTGTSWAVVPSPNPFTGPGADDELNAVGGTSASDLWAAGFDFEGNIAQGLFAHFNGTTWQAAPPLVAAGIPDFVSVSAVSANDVWAVGTSSWRQRLDPGRPLGRAHLAGGDHALPERDQDHPPGGRVPAKQQRAHRGDRRGHQRRVGVGL